MMNDLIVKICEIFIDDLKQLIHCRLVNHQWDQIINCITFNRYSLRRKWEKAHKLLQKNSALIEPHLIHDSIRVVFCPFIIKDLGMGWSIVQKRLCVCSYKGLMKLIPHKDQSLKLFEKVESWNIHWDNDARFALMRSPHDSDQILKIYFDDLLNIRYEILIGSFIDICNKMQNSGHFFDNRTFAQTSFKIIQFNDIHESIIAQNQIDDDSWNDIGIVEWMDKKWITNDKVDSIFPFYDFSHRFVLVNTESNSFINEINVDSGKQSKSDYFLLHGLLINCVTWNHMNQQLLIFYQSNLEPFVVLKRYGPGQWKRIYNLSPNERKMQQQLKKSKVKFWLYCNILNEYVPFHMPKTNAIPLDEWVGSLSNKYITVKDINQLEPDETIHMVPVHSHVNCYEKYGTFVQYQPDEFIKSSMMISFKKIKGLYGWCSRSWFNDPSCYKTKLTYLGGGKNVESINLLIGTFDPFSNNKIGPYVRLKDLYDSCPVFHEYGTDIKIFS